MAIPAERLVCLEGRGQNFNWEVSPAPGFPIRGEKPRFVVEPVDLPEALATEDAGPSGVPPFQPGTEQAPVSRNCDLGQAILTAIRALWPASARGESRRHAVEGR